jgi:hypothetical protein
VRSFFGMPLSAFRPLLSDEVYYWHEVSTFAHAGLNGGYYTLEEVTNPSGFTPFGPHGPGFVVLYGLIAKVFEWPRHGVLVVNLVVIALAAWFWTAHAGVTTARLWLSAILLATFWQVLFWAPTGMQESLHHAGAITMAALFGAALASPPRRWLIVVGCLALGILSLVRPTWIVLMPLWALVVSRDATRARMTAAVTASLVAAALMLIAFNRSVAPYSRGFSFVEVFNFSIGTNSIVENVLFNLRRTVTFSEYDDLEILHRIQYWVFLTFAAVLAIRRWWQRADRRSSSAVHLAVVAMSMFIMLTLMLVLYSLTNWAEHRVLSAFLLFGALLTLTAPGRAPLVLVTALIVSNLATTTTFGRVFEAKRHDQFVWDRRGVLELQEAVAGRVIYRENQPRWCNTLLTAQEPPYLISVPAGVAISVVREPDQVAVPPRSRYLLLDAPAMKHFQRPLHVRPLATLPYGTLYLNLESGCDPPSAEAR